MKSSLIKKFNVPANHFLTLTDEQATHDAIIAGFRKQLIENAKAHRDALVIFQYSGHGSQVKDRTGSKADGLDSTLVPVNSRDLKGSYFDIVDDEIRELFDELSQYNLKHRLHHRCLSLRQSDTRSRKNSWASSR